MTQIATVTVTSATCCKCGYEIWMTEGYKRARRRDHKWFYCTSCGTSQHWSQESKEERLARELRAANQREETQRQRLREAREATERERKVAQGYKGAWVKTKKRIGKGTCPCCKRHFSNVERHMATQHPEYAGVADDE